jgi:hypothetical protein
MEINNATASPMNTLANNPQQPEPGNRASSEKQPERQQESAVVELSAKAQQMNRAENQVNGAENQNAGHTGAKPQETAEPPGIKFMEGDKKGGNVDTFA